MQNRKKKSWKLNLVIVFTLAAVTMLFAPDVAAKEYRLRVEVDEPFEVHGERFEAGTLTIREFANLNPTSTLHELSLGKSSLGMLVGKAATRGETAERDAAIFKRNASGTLVLVGVTFRGHPVRELFHFDDEAEPRAWVRPATAPARDLIAAR